MFENVIGQDVTAQLITDIETGILPQALLFSGPKASGKGTAALELARVISCEAEAQSSQGQTPARKYKALWTCQCPACPRHRLLIHQDLLCIGPRAFSAEIAASSGAFLREINSTQNVVKSASRMLFIRSIRKLLLRFNPVLFEDEPKKGKTAVAPLVNTLEEDLAEFDALTQVPAESTGERIKEDALAKLIEAIQKNAFKLEAEGLSDNIPIDRIRRAAWWGRLAPSGKGKLLVIENTDRMQEEARNSLLKLLEEPPPRLTIVLTTARPSSLLPTILSRVRPYRFNARDASVEKDIIKKVFRDDKDTKLTSYLDSFLPVSEDELNSLVAFFAASVAYKAALLSKKQGNNIAQEVIVLGKYTAPKAEAAGLGRPKGEVSAVTALVLEKTNKFEVRSLFLSFLSGLLEIAVQSQREAALPSVSYNEVWRKHSSWGESAVGTYRLTPALVLEKLFTSLSRDLAAL